MTGHPTPAECLEELDRLEKETRRRWSMSLSRRTGLYEPFDDNGKNRDIACATKVLYTSKARAKRALKLMKSRGRHGLELYPCWYSRNGDHYHLGYPPGEQTYKRAGRAFG
jgi:hypothetical protein